MAEKKPDPAPVAAEAPSAAPAAAASKGGGVKAMLPALLSIILAPAATFAVAHFVLLPRFESGLQNALAGSGGEAHGAAAPAAAASEKSSEKPAGEHGGGKSGKSGKSGHGASAPAEGNSYNFENVVVNLSGTMGTRYLKVAFLVTGEKSDVGARFAAARPQLGDVTLAVLSSLTLSDLEEAGSKNLIRERLLAAYNQALGGKVVDGLFFSEFVVQ